MNPDKSIGASRKWLRIHRTTSRAWNALYYHRLKTEVFKHYSPTLSCAKCGFNDGRALSIDHINGGGHAHRKTIGGTQHFYLWLKRNEYPAGYQILCMNCQAIKRLENQETAMKDKMANRQIHELLKTEGLI